MEIAFDAQPIIEDQKTGIGYHEAGITNALLTLFPTHQYCFNYFSYKNKERKKTCLLPYNQKGAKIKECAWFPGSLYRLLWNFIPLPYQWFFGRDAAVTHFFNFHVPPGVRGKKIVTVHDMAYKRFPQTIRFKTMVMLQLSLKHSCRRADIIVTVSEFSKEEIIRLLKVEPEKIVVVPNGVDTEFFSPVTSRVQLDAVQTKYHITGSYLLYMGTLEPRKNIERLIEAYASVKKSDPNTPVLVLAGRKGWLYDTIFERVRTLDLTRDIVFTDYVAEEDVPALLSGALAFLFPSLYEGFGMPPLEAMACGTPVLTSDVSSLPEVVGDAAILVNPYAINDIARGILALIHDAALRETLSLKGIARAQMYNWQHSATLMMKIYKNTVTQ